MSAIRYLRTWAMLAIFLAVGPPIHAQPVSDPTTDKSRALIEAAELRGEARDGPGALALYTEAFEFPDAKEVAAWGALGLFEAAIVTNREPMLRWAERCRTNGFAEIYSRCLGEALNAPSSPSDRETTFLLWLESVAERKAVTLREFLQLKGPIRSNPGYLEWTNKLASLAKTNILNNWTQRLEHRYVAATALLSLARQQRAEKSPALAISLCEEALTFAPQEPVYLAGRERPFVRLDIAAELAALHHNYSSKTVAAVKLADLEKKLFDDKSREYAKSSQLNYRRLEKYHTTLGVIYADTGKWSRAPSDPDDYHNANFQLQTAIRFAESNAAAAGVTTKPVPDLRNRLGKALLDRGDTNRAAQLLVDAAEGYVEVGNYSSAGLVLTNTLKSVPPTHLPAKYSALQDIVISREQLKNFNKTDFKSVPNFNLRELNTLPRLDPSRTADPNIRKLLQREQQDAVATVKSKIATAPNTSVPPELRAWINNESTTVAPAAVVNVRPKINVVSPSSSTPAQQLEAAPAATSPAAAPEKSTVAQPVRKRPNTVIAPKNDQ